PRSTAAKETPAPAIISAPATAEPDGSPSQAPPPVPPAASPATSGAIQLHTDSGGVLHIGNVAPSQPTSSQPYDPSVVPEALMVGPRRAWSRHLRLLGQIEETSAPESDLDAIQKACQGLALGEAQAHEFDGIIVAAEQAAAEMEAAEVAVDYNYLPVSQVYHDQGVSPAASPTAEAAAAGDIRRYRDARGVLHFSNAAPRAEDCGPAVEMAQSPNNPGGEARELGQPAATQPRLPFRQAAWNPEDRRLATLPTTSSAAKQAAPGSPSPIREYRDSKRVIHISNVDPEPREAPRPAGLMARSSAAAGFEPLARRPLPAAGEGEGGLAWRPVAWNGEGGIQPFKRVQAAPSQTAEVITEGGIRRYRDTKGVTHIKTVEYPLPPGVVLPPRQAGPGSMAPMAAAPMAPAVPNLPDSAPSPLPATPTTLSGAGPRITAFKDAKGRLRITTELPPPVPGQMPPMPVYAELEPIILEAAQIHRLPPTLIKAVIKAESNFCSWAVSPKGAMGLMQLMPGTAEFLGVREPFNPRDNILGGCRYLRELIDLFGGNLPLALASYNAGFQRVIDCGYQIPSIKETQNFVTAVMGRYVAEEKRGRQPST
ncbi:MAG: lytic transglycosylase domain-containing protein, partial [Desulfobaccales bacterium]